MHLITEDDPFVKHGCFLAVFSVFADVEDDNIMTVDVESTVHGHSCLPQRFIYVLILDIW